MSLLPKKYKAPHQQNYNKLNMPNIAGRFICKYEPVWNSALFVDKHKWKWGTKKHLNASLLQHQRWCIKTVKQWKLNKLNKTFSYRFQMYMSIWSKTVHWFVVFARTMDTAKLTVSNRNMSCVQYVQPNVCVLSMNESLFHASLRIQTHDNILSQRCWPTVFSCRL